MHDNSEFKTIKDISFTQLVMVHYALISSYENDKDTDYIPGSLLYNKQEDLYELKYELVENNIEEIESFK